MTVYINGTTGLSGVDGSSSTPALQGADTNTGISFGTDTVTINTGGVARVTTDSSGNLLVGTTSNTGSVNGHELSKSGAAGNFCAAVVNSKLDNSTATLGFMVKYTGVSPNDGNYMFLCRDSSNSDKFYVLNNGTTGGASDATLKTNIVDATPKLADLLSIKVRNFEWIGDQTHTKCLGVIAQEVEEVFPALVQTEGDGTKTVKHSVFVPMLIKAIQELKSELDSVKAELATLKAGE